MKNARSVALVILAVVLLQRFRWFQTDLPPTFGGSVHPAFQKVYDVFRENIETNQEKAACFSAYYKGNLVVDLWGGYADIETAQTWQENTLSIMFSSTKGVTAVLAALFVQKGYLDYKKLVTHYWPEFGKNGKENVTVEMLLSHQAGLSITNGTIDIRLLRKDPRKVEKFLEDQRPIWTPGTAYSYHVITFGMYVDVLLRKADPKHRNIDQIFREEIAEPFDIDIHYGMPRSELYRNARFVPLTLTGVVKHTFQTLSLDQLQLFFTIINPMSMFMRASYSGFNQELTFSAFNNPDLNQIPLTSFLGFGNSRSLAKLWGIVANGGTYKNKTLLTPAMIDLLETPVTSGRSVDGLFNISVGRGVFFLSIPQSRYAIGHPGYGGQTAYADARNKVGIGYLTSYLKSFTFGDDVQFLQFENGFDDMTTTDIDNMDMEECNGVVESAGLKVQTEETVQSTSSTHKKTEETFQSASATINETEETFQSASATINETEDEHVTNDKERHESHPPSITSFESQTLPLSNTKAGEGNETIVGHCDLHKDNEIKENLKASQDLLISSNNDEVNHPASSMINEAQSVSSETTGNIESGPSGVLPANPSQPITDEQTVTDVEVNGTIDRALDSTYREKQDESAESSSDSEDSVVLVQEEQQKCIVIESDDQEENRSKGKKDSEVRTKGELYPDELPPIDELVITVDPNVELVHTGSITGIVGCLAIVKANQSIPPLNENTILFLEGRVVLGQIFEVFGPVGSPWYSVRFNSTTDIESKSLCCGQKVYCAPKVENLTNYVFVEHLRQMKGSDASWEDNNEPPSKYVDYSDDEEERRAKAKARNRGNEEDGHQLPGAKKVRRRRQRDRHSFSKNGTEETNLDVGDRTSSNPSHTNQREHNSNLSGQGRNFSPRAGRHQSQPRMEYQSFQPFGAPPRFPQISENQNNLAVYQNGGPVRQPVFQPRYPDPNVQNWSNQSQNQTVWNQNMYPSMNTTQPMNYQYCGQNQTIRTSQNGGPYYPQFSGGIPNMSLPPPPHFGQPPPVFNRPMLTDQRYIQNSAFQQTPRPQYDPNVPPPNFNVE
ncbi:uncharacterized protein LOC125671923 isoform X2 [Ostrea edulis]|uniref:uncharacterized protein LOC125671923 isoform X2 n=1 Tax=Ostrea edulis TaxID=37623 RepID=UPI0024AF71CF|nr:uncharacterized protein LOC125671923 isoform X2 [Ostrea edulis]